MKNTNAPGASASPLKKHSERPGQAGPLALVLAGLVVAGLLLAGHASATQLEAGAAKVDITNTKAGPVNDPLYAKALVLRSGNTTAVLITVDAVSIGEIGHIGNDYLDNVRVAIEKELDIGQANILINASHCHGVVCAEVEQRTVQAVREAAKNLVPVTVGAGIGHEDRVMENRRLRLEDGTQADVRHAYSLPPDEAVGAVGPIDPEIGLLRLDRQDGRTLAVVYNFTCHPIQGVPSGGNTADITGFASRVIEENASDGTIALFLQGCAGDVNPVLYKDVDHPRNAEPLGNMLGLSTLRALRGVSCKEDGRLTIVREILELPRADNGRRIVAMEAEREQLVRSLRGTSLNLKTFLALRMKYGLSSEFPSYDSHRYLHDRAIGRDDFDRLDDLNRHHLKRYLGNIHAMEQLTRLQTNLALLQKHQATNAAAEKKTLDVEVLGMRIGEFVLITFPGELTVQTGLDIKNASPHELTFVAAYSNGYIYYAPTAEELKNVGRTQEDSDCLVAPEWHKLYERKVGEILGRL